MPIFWSWVYAKYCLYRALLVPGAVVDSHSYNVRSVCPASSMAQVVQHIFCSFLSCELIVALQVVHDDSFCFVDYVLAALLLQLFQLWVLPYIYIKLLVGAVKGGTYASGHAMGALDHIGYLLLLVASPKSRRVLWVVHVDLQHASSLWLGKSCSLCFFSLLLGLLQV